MRSGPLFVASLIGLMSGCILPVATGMPMSASTVGDGNVGASISGEAPVLDLLADGDEYTELRGAAPAAAMTLTIAYGLGDNTDLEVAGEGALYFFILPLPTGGSLGFRHRVTSTDLFDLAVAAKVGVVGSSASTTVNGSTTESGASAKYAAIQGVIQRRDGWVRPLVALNAMPFQIRRDPGNEASYRFNGIATSATLAVMAIAGRVQIGPYFTVTNFTSQRFAGGTFPSFGVMLSLRPDPPRPHEPTMEETPYYGPPPPTPPPGPAPPVYAPPAPGPADPPPVAAPPAPAPGDASPAPAPGAAPPGSVDPPPAAPSGPPGG